MSVNESNQEKVLCCHHCENDDQEMFSKNGHNKLKDGTVKQKFICKKCNSIITENSETKRLTKKQKDLIKILFEEQHRSISYIANVFGLKNHSINAVKLKMKLNRKDKSIYNLDNIQDFGGNEE